MSKWVVYILECADHSLYTGITTDVLRRVEEHNSDNKKGAKYTRVRRPVKLKYAETVPDRSSASSREHAIKQLTRRQKNSLIQAHTLPITMHHE